MNALWRWIKSPLLDKWLILESIFWLGLARMVVLGVPFRHVAGFLGKQMAETSTDSLVSDAYPVRIGRSIRLTAKHMPWDANCLAQAVAGKAMLSLRGYPTTIYFGVQKSEEGELKAHAWLRFQDKILTGGKGHGAFSVIATYA